MVRAGINSGEKSFSLISVQLSYMMTNSKIWKLRKCSRSLMEKVAFEGQFESKKRGSEIMNAEVHSQHAQRSIQPSVKFMFKEVLPNGLGLRGRTVQFEVQW